MKNIVLIALFGLFLLPAGGIHAQNSFALGEDLFLHNRPQEALRHLEMAIREDPAHVQAFLYLGIVYKQLNRIDDAIAVYQQILPRSGLEAARVVYNLGNALFMKGEHAEARFYYTQALELDPSFIAAYLNRGNSLIRTGDLDNAIRDYETYLMMDPGTSQREQILRLINFVREEQAAAERLRIMAEEAARAAEEAARAEVERQRLIAEEAIRVAEENARIAEAAARAAEEAARIEAEQQRLIAEEAARIAAEEARIAAETARLAEEAARAAEEAIRAAEEAALAEAERQRLIEEEAARIAAERRRQLLEEISESLQAAAGDSTGLWAGAEDMHEFESEFELD